MKSWLGCFGLVAVAVLACAACSEANPTTGAGGSGGAGGGAGTGGAGGSTGGSGGSGAEDGGDGEDGGGLGPSTTKLCSVIYENDKITYTPSTVPVYTCNGSKSTTYPTGPNACRNDADCAIINTGKVRELVRNCALSCRSFEPAPTAPESERVMKCGQMADCNNTCVKMATATMIMQPGITNGCGKCYTDVALCSISECLSECAVDADAIECIKCQFAKGCRVPYERCSGLDRQ
jgi:hypothetical protein